jgi:hypothetical protein
MRRTLLLTLLAALLVPAAAGAAPSAPAASADGTLALRGGDGRLVLVGFRGAFIGRVVDGRLTIVEPRGGSCETQLVWAWDTLQERIIPGGELGQGRLACIYGGAEIRFRLVGFQSEVRLRGINIAASIVGRGTAVLEGDGGFFDGMYSLNGDSYRSLPDLSVRLALGPPPVIP